MSSVTAPSLTVGTFGSIEYLLAEDGDILGSGDPDLYTISFDSEDFDNDVPVDDKGLFNLSCEDEHGGGFLSLLRGRWESILLAAF